MELTNAQCNRIESFVNSPTPNKKDGRGRPARHPREVLDGILSILRTGAPWKDMPQRYPPYPICHRRFQQWVRQFLHTSFRTKQGILYAFILINVLKPKAIAIDKDSTNCLHFISRPVSFQLAKLLFEKPS